MLKIIPSVDKQDASKRQEMADAIRLMVVSSILSDYAALALIDFTKRDLKDAVQGVRRAVKRVENWFLTHENTDEFNRKVFLREFNKNEIVLMGELVQTVWGLSEETLEDIIKAIKRNIDETQNQQP